MFAPPTDAVCSTAIGSEILPRDYGWPLIPGLDDPWPDPLVPVYRCFCLVARSWHTVVLGFMARSSRVGH